ncbi:MAG: HelD family protein [Lachnospiraceae bacterium]
MKQEQRTVAVPQNDGDTKFPDEIEHLSQIQEKLTAALEQAGQSVDHIDREYMAAKRYMVQNRGEIDPHEMFQNELDLRRIDHSGAFAVEVRDRLARLQASPYFGRIDFKEEDTGSLPYYIGRFAFHYQNELLIFDWRAPVAGIFYEYETGPAGYQAPCGRIEGELTRKRQFKISNGVMEYALESSDNVQDDVLQRELSNTSDEKMKSIILTIQKEQNQIIRNEKASTLIIQGVAGSGKTSIALHRIAYLLYRFKERLSAHNITIISPNRVFGDYISNVLPELGEEPIFEISFTDLAEVQLEKVIGFEPDRGDQSWNDAAWIRRVQFKSTLEFVRQMDDYISRLPELVLDPKEYQYDPFSVSAEWIRARFGAYPGQPLMRRLTLVAEDIREYFDSNNIQEDELPGVRTILKNLKTMLRFKKTLALYKDFYSQAGQSEMLVMPDKKTLEWNDVFPFLYLHAAFQGLQESQLIRHLVVDEMQDYTPVQFAVLNRLFRCQKTILGDFGQSINPNFNHTLTDLQQLYQGAELVRLNKSYRSTYEIISFARQIQPGGDLEAMERHGEMPEIIGCEDDGDQRIRVIEIIDAFNKGSGNTMGIILKTDKAARKLYKILRTGRSISLIEPGSSGFENGISVTSVRMSKGLEFDAVVIPDADNQTFKTEHDRSLLYVACTRAMHQLTLLYSGEKSAFIDHI